jgi:hypothetical protein
VTDLQVESNRVHFNSIETRALIAVMFFGTNIDPGQSLYSTADPEPGSLQFLKAASTVVKADQ